MELFDYIAHRWKAWLGALSLGVIVLVLVGSGLGAREYRSQAQILVRPSANELSTYASNPDRFVDTEMALLGSQSGLSRTAKRTGMSPSELGSALSYTHEPDSEIVVLAITASAEQVAVDTVNAVARSYVDNSAATSGPGDSQSQALTDQINQTQRQLDRTTSQVQQAIGQFVLNNPDSGTPPASTVAPQLDLRQSLLTNRLQQLTAEQTRIALDTATAGTRSAVLKRATGAVSVGAWGPTTLLAAIVGWVLVLLTLAAAGLALSSRVLSVSRWSQATNDGTLGVPVRLRSRTRAQRRRTARRVIETLRARGTRDEPVVMTYQPELTPKLRDRTASLVEDLREQGIRIEEPVLEDDGRVVEPHDVDLAERRLLVADLSATRIDDARSLSNRWDRGRTTTVLV